MAKGKKIKLAAAKARKPAKAAPGSNWEKLKQSSDSKQGQTKTP